MTLAAVLIREEQNQQIPIYYVNQVLHEAEMRYQRVEKLAYALVMEARKLRSYFQALTIKVMTDQPLRQIVHRPDTSGRLVKWAVELSEFDIRYLPRQAIKAQVLADFMAECTIPTQGAAPETEAVQPPGGEELPTLRGQIRAKIAKPPGEMTTTSPKGLSQEGTKQPRDGEFQTSLGEHDLELYVDGSSNKLSSGAGLILIGPENFVMDYAIRFGFCTSKNEAEYEALIAGMNLAVQTLVAVD
ncbi:uncharacterized protein LOC143861370 [Tasmannia lanceolata]|uniref:uncharacterized protein LOC143861370 n=1 Tax=Tasmannia lanceolata TaxID=3420 RepID=UPI0040631346